MESKKKKYFGEPLLRLVDQKTDLELMYPESKANIIVYDIYFRTLPQIACE